MIDKKTFQGGLDSDSSDKLLAPGDYRYLLNGRNGVTQEGNSGEITNVKGNSKIAFNYAIDDQITIGAYFVSVVNCIYYFNYSAVGEHGIYEYNCTTKVISEVKRHSLFNFNKDFLITSVRYVDGLLYWTDNYNQPRKINIQKAKLHVAGDYVNGYDGAFKEEYIRIIKYPMLYPPTAAYGSDSLFPQNNLRGSLYQFRVQYVFDDDEVSSFSPISIPPLPDDENEFYFGSAISVTANNYIRLEYNSGSSIVTKIRLSVRMGNTGDFFLFDTIDKKDNLMTSNTVYSYNFYNNTPLLPIEINESIKLFDFIPLKSKVLDIVNNNRLILGNNLENYDNVAVEAIAELVSTGVNISAPSVTLSVDRSGENSFGGRKSGWESFTLDTLGNEVSGVVFAIEFYGSTFTYTGGPTDNAYTALEKLGNKIYEYNWNGTAPFYVSLFDLPRISVYVTQITSNIAKMRLHWSIEDVYIPSSSFTSSYIPPINKTLKSASKFKYGIVYYDEANRSTTVQIPSPQSTTGKLGGLTLETKELFIDERYYANQARISIYNAPPPWAKRFQIVRTKNLKEGTYIQVLVSAAPTAPANKNYIELNIIYIKNYNAAYAGANLSYSFVKGDRVRLIRSVNNANNVANANNAVATAYGNMVSQKFTTDYQFATFINYLNNDPIAFLSSFFEGVSGQEQWHSAGAKSTINNSNNYFDATTVSSYNTWYNSYSTWETYKLIYANALQNQINANAAQPEVPAVDVEVLGYNATTYTLTIKKNDDYPFYYQDQIEIYTPLKNLTNQQELYYEIGASYEIGQVVNGGRIHYGNVQRQSDANNYATYPAIILLDEDFTDFLRIRDSTAATETTFRLFEDKSYHDMYPSEIQNIGRPNRYSPENKEKRNETDIRYSQQFIQDTDINGLSTFYDLDFEAYPLQNGSIQQCYYKNNRLITFFENKVSAIPIDQRVMTTATGQTTVGLSDRVLNQEIPFLYEGGIGLNPESFDYFENNMYFVDIRRGNVCRLAGDGVTPISEYKMHNYFNDRCKAILDSGVSRVLGVYDRRFSNYIVSFAAVNSANQIVTNPVSSSLNGSTGGNPVSYVVATDYSNGVYNINPNIIAPTYSQYQISPDTIAFDERSNRWRQHFSYYPEMMCKAGIDIVSFNNGNVYLHNSSDIYNNFYGITSPTELWVVSNASPSNVKIWEAIGLESTDTMEAYELLTPNGQESLIYSTDYENKENMYYAAMRFDTNTPNVASPQEGLFNGDVLRDVTMIAKLRTSTNKFFKIFAVNFEIIISDLHGR